jgi:hypothetical protein
MFLILRLTDDLLGMDLARCFLEGRAGNIRSPRCNRISPLAGNLSRGTRLLPRLGQRNPRDTAQPNVATLAANHRS